MMMIEQFTSGMDFDAFRSNTAERRCPNVPWRDIRGIGNQLRHAHNGSI